MNTSRVLLVAYSGYPEVNSTWLHLDNGLALLAGALLAAGHQVRIKDLQTLDTWARLFPHERRDEYFQLRQGFDHYVHERGSGQIRDESVLAAGQRFDAWVGARNAQVVQQIGREVAVEFERFDPQVIGFKLWSQNSFPDQVAIARVLKESFPQATLVAGGPAVELLQEAVFRHTDVFDVLVHGPGEQAIVDLVRMKAQGRVAYDELPSAIYLEDGRPIKTERRDPTLAIGVMPYYGRDVYVDYDKKLHNVHVESDRGCNFKCEFCIHPQKSGRLQKKSVQDFVAELVELNRLYGFSYFHLAGSDPPFRHMVEISKEVVGNGLDFGFMGFQSLRALDDTGLDHLQKANFDRLWVGIETGDADIVFDIQKGRKLDRLEARAEVVKRRGIAITGSVITPCPGEREGSVDATITLLDKIRPDVVLMYPPIVQPGSTWFRATGYPVNVVDRVLVEDLFVRHGMEWHPGNKVLPWAFSEPHLNDLIQINGKGYIEVYCESTVNQRKINRNVSAKSAVAQFGDRSRHRSLLKRLYFRSQISVSHAIRCGEFAAAANAIAEYNRFVLRGRYSLQSA
jgi:hypothetical protein